MRRISEAMLFSGPDIQDVLRQIVDEIDKNGGWILSCGFQQDYKGVEATVVIE